MTARTSSPSTTTLSGAARVFDLSLGELIWSRRTIFMALVVGAPIVLATVARIVQSSGIAPLRVNGVEKQRGSTRNMIFPVDALIASLSSGLTLEPGDILAAGTPEGVGFARTPPEFLQHGDVMETEVEGIGVMRNRIVARGA